MNETQFNQKNAQVKDRQVDLNISAMKPPTLDIKTVKCAECELLWTPNAVKGGVCYICRRDGDNEQKQGARLVLWKRFVVPRFEDAEVKHLEDKVQCAWTNIDDKYKGLLLWGGVGAGKSYAMTAFARVLILKGGMDVRRTTYKRMYAAITGTYGGDFEFSELQAIDRYSKAEVLIIEDIGIRPEETQNSLDVFMAILDYRYEHLLLTFLTSNRKPEHLGEAFDDRVLSRIRQMCEIVEVKHDDRRIK